MNNTTSSIKSNDLELGEIPNTSNTITNTTEKKINTKALNSPLARLFFDPPSPIKSPSIDPPNDNVPNVLKTNKRRPEISNSQDSESSKVDSARSRSRDLDRRSNRVSDEEDKDTKKKNRRLMRKNQHPREEAESPLNLAVVNSDNSPAQEES